MMEGIYGTDAGQRFIEIVVFVSGRVTCIYPPLEGVKGEDLF
jgi:hypothetical protein